MSFEIGFEGSVSADRSKMKREGIPSRRANMLKTTRCESNIDTRWERRLREAE